MNLLAPNTLQTLTDFLDYLKTASSCIEIFTDGACSGNPGIGGWGAIFKCGKIEWEHSGFDLETTNNRMEMMAAIESIQCLPFGKKITVHTDSQYLKDGITLWLKNWKKNGWKTSNKKPVKNQDLWESLEELSQNHEITWCWVKGHNGHIENERADALARRAIIAGRIKL